MILVEKGCRTELIIPAAGLPSRPAELARAQKAVQVPGTGTLTVARRISVSCTVQIFRDDIYLTLGNFPQLIKILLEEVIGMVMIDFVFVIDCHF